MMNDRVLAAITGVVLFFAVGSSSDKGLICVSHVVACIVARAASILKDFASECVPFLMSFQLIYIVQLIIGDCVAIVKGLALDRELAAAIVLHATRPSSSKSFS